MPDVSVIMNAYNAEKYLREAIHSIYAQTHRDWEIIFWDNASTDGTAEIAKSYDKKLRYFRGETTVPLGQARNYAVSQADGQYIAFLDCDDLWMPQKLEAQLKLFGADPTLGLVYCDGYTIDGRGDILYRFSDVFSHARGNIFRKLFVGHFIPPVSAIIKRSVFDTVGLSRAFDIADDYDLYLRIAYQYPIDYVNETLFKYRWHDTNLSQYKLDKAYTEKMEIQHYWLAGAMDTKTRNWIKKQIADTYWGYGSWLLARNKSWEARKNLLRGLQFPPKPARLLKYGLSWLPSDYANSILSKLRSYL